MNVWIWLYTCYSCVRSLVWLTVSGTGPKPTSRKIHTIKEAASWLCSSVTQLNHLTDCLGLRKSLAPDDNIIEKNLAEKNHTCVSIAVPKTIFDAINQGTVSWFLRPCKGTNMRKRIYAHGARITFSCGQLKALRCWVLYVGTISWFKLYIFSLSPVVKIELCAHTFQFKFE